MAGCDQQTTQKGDEKAALDKQVDRLQELRTQAGDKLSEAPNLGRMFMVLQIIFVNLSKSCGVRR